MSSQKNRKKKSKKENKGKKEKLTENEQPISEQQNHSDPENDTVESSDNTTTESIPEPKKVERKIKHPKTNVVNYDDPDIDSNWGWALEFPNDEQLLPIWEKLKNYLDNNQHPCKGTVSWLSLDPRGYFSPRLRHFISFTGYGVQIQNMPDWFKEKISEVKSPIKVFEPSEELADGNWQGYIVKEKIQLTGSEYIKLNKFSRNKRKTVEEAKKPVSSKIARYWTQNPLFKSRDYLIPVITEEKYKIGEFSNLSYLEEYIVEQLEWQEAKGHLTEFVVLPSEFTFDETANRKIKIPEEYTPEVEFDYPGMFPGMGGMGGLGGMGDMPDFGDMPDLDDSELGDLDSEESEEVESSEEQSSEDKVKSKSDSKDDVIDAEVISSDKK